MLGEIYPRWFVGENTPGLFARSNQRYFRRVLDDLAALGYSVGWGIWGACDVGAPHKRQRVFIIANKISDTTFKRFDSDEIHRGVPSQGRNEENKRRVRPCGVQPFGICSSPSGKIDWLEAEPDVGRLVDGVPHRVDRLRCLGNAVVPQQAYPIFEAIAQFEGGKG